MTSPRWLVLPKPASCKVSALSRSHSPNPHVASHVRQSQDHQHADRDCRDCRGDRRDPSEYLHDFPPVSAGSATAARNKPSLSGRRDRLPAGDPIPTARCPGRAGDSPAGRDQQHPEDDHFFTGAPSRIIGLLYCGNADDRFSAGSWPGDWPRRGFAIPCRLTRQSPVKRGTAAAERTGTRERHHPGRLPASHADSCRPARRLPQPGNLPEG
jgi:hypothetical protein